MAEKKRRARGEGSIRQRKDGTWEARFVAGVDPGTGKDIRKSVYAKTQKEVRKKMTEAIAALDKDDYREPSKMTVGQWLDVWAAEYLGGLNTPLGMIVLGVNLSQANVLSCLKDKTVYLISFVKLLVVPLLSAGALYVLGAQTVTAMALLIGVAAPSGVIASMMA